MSKTLGRVRKTSRGFEVIEFKDHYAHGCSLQQSSLAIYQQPGSSALWLGPDDADPKVLHHQAASVGVKTDKTEGWVPYPIPGEVSLNTRMHLNRHKVEALIHHLQAWLDTGSLRIRKEKKEKQAG